MRYMALATDYDGTLARDGIVSEKTVAALSQFRKSGRTLILVTGRELGELEAVFPRLDLFHRVVAENGALLYNPETREKRALAEQPHKKFLDELSRRGVAPVSAGEVIVATWRPHETAVLETIRDLGLEMNVIFNKGAVMILPSGINKNTGLKAALAEMGLSEHNVAGVGDAENDHAFLSCCECGAAVANALDSLKETADLVLTSAHGEGVQELIEKILADDLRSCAAELKRHDIVIGHAGDEPVSLPAYGSNLLVTGASGSGKSTFATGLMESLQKRELQVCLIDPEGDYGSVRGAIVVGDEQNSASEDQVLQALQRPSAQVVVNLVGIPIQDRPAFFARLLPRLEDARLRAGRPHWILVDESHHMFPAESLPHSAQLTPDISNLVLITVHPDHVSPAVLLHMNVVAVIGKSPRNVMDAVAQAAGTALPDADFSDLSAGQALLWFRDRNEIRRIEFTMPAGEHNRHKRKYAQGEMEPERSFYFVGPRGQFKLRAQNLLMFLQLAEGLDDETWTHHLKAGDYSTWFREGVKDEDLGAEAEAIEKNHELDAASSRRQMKRLIEDRYTAPA